MDKKEFYNSLCEWASKEDKQIKRKLFVHKSLKKVLKKMAKKLGINDNFIKYEDLIK